MEKHDTLNSNKLKSEATWTVATLCLLFQFRLIIEINIFHRLNFIRNPQLLLVTRNLIFCLVVCDEKAEQNLNCRKRCMHNDDEREMKLPTQTNPTSPLRKSKTFSTPRKKKKTFPLLPITQLNIFPFVSRRPIRLHSARPVVYVHIPSVVIYLQLNYFPSISLEILLSFKSFRSCNFPAVQRRQLRKNHDDVVSIARIIWDRIVSG